MKYLAILILLGLVGCASTPQPTATSKHDLAFTAQSTYVAKRVEWIVVDNIDSACHGVTAITSGQRYLGCAKFTATSCKVYTARNTTLSILGHEIRHCFEGRWHK
jgi:hypothetical protein